MLSNIRNITPQTLVNELAAMGPQGFRFVTLTCLDLGDKLLRGQAGGGGLRICWRRHGRRRSRLALAP